jgi:hypothetical protein
MVAKAKAPAYFAAPWELVDATALQALQRGEANADQQKRALDWIIEVGASTYQPTFHPGEPDASAFAEGRRFVGMQIVKLLKINTNVLLNAKENHNA